MTSFVITVESLADGGGPRCIEASLDRPAQTVSMTVDKPLKPATVSAEAFAVSVLTDAGWHVARIAGAEVDGASRTVTVTFREDPGAGTVRFIAFGSGRTPLLGKDGAAFAGASGGPPGATDTGHDYVRMFVD